MIPKLKGLQKNFDETLRQDLAKKWRDYFYFILYYDYLYLPSSNLVP